MRKRRKLLGTALGVLLAVLTFAAGPAWALYAGDGSKPDPATGGWAITDYGRCISGIKSNGSMTTDPDHNLSRPDCLDHVLTGTDYDTQAECIAITGRTDPDGAGGPLPADEESHFWANTCVDGSGNGISMAGLDRTSANCVLKGGTWKSACTGAWIYTGPNNDGVGYEGGGFCYTNIDVTHNASYDTEAECNAAGNTTGFAWQSTGTWCRFSYGTAGYVNAKLVKKDGSTAADAGTFIDLSGYTTMGTCLWNGGSWGTGVIKNGTFAIAGNGGTKPLDSTGATLVNARAGCLECHNSVSQNNQYAERWKEGYLKTGHKNMLRKVTAGEQLAGPDGVSYESTGWANGTLDFVSATATATTGTNLFTDSPLMYIFGDWMAPAPAGLDVVVWKGAAAGYNGGSAYSCTPCHSTGWSNTSAGICVVLAVAKPTSGTGAVTTQAACEALPAGTWYPMSGVQGASYNPAEPGASWAGNTLGITVNADNSIPGITGRWDRDGILCSRCHQSVFSPTIPAPVGTNGHNVTPATTANQQVNNICFGCHQSIGKVADNTGTDTDLGDPGLNIPVKNNATAPDYVPEFNGHVIANEFLNSPHARYSAPASGNAIVPNGLGKFDLVTNAASQYASPFKGFLCRSSATVGGGSILMTYWDTSTTPAAVKEIKTQAECNIANGKPVATVGYWQAENQGACTTCHNVHESLFDPAAEEPLKRECETCHIDESGVGGTGYADALVPQIDLAKTNHPTGAGTPWDTSEHVNACEVCHMPKATSAGFPIHLWRISTDAAYSTFPTAAEFGTKKNANVDAAGKIWIDAGIACNQCHKAGGPANAAAFTVAQAAAGAKAMHDGGSATNADCLTCHAAGNTVGAPVIIPGLETDGGNHHGLYRTCVTCHPGGHNGTLPDKTDNNYCLTCHTNSGAHAVHHAVPGLTVSGSPKTCQSCHTLPGATVPPTSTRDQTMDPTVGCMGCHKSAQGAHRALVVSGTGDNHHRGSNASLTTTPPRDTAGCIYCHNTGKAFGDATTEVMIDQVAPNTCNGACHASTLPSANTHHKTATLTGDFSCLTCHVPGQPGEPGNTDPAVWPPASWEDCTACHSVPPMTGATSVIQSGAEQNHHVGICTTCHTIPGVAQMTTTDTSCLSCHATAQGTFGPIATLNHNTGAGTPASYTPEVCAKCHVQPGVAPSVAVTCGQCHYGTGSIPVYSEADLAVVADGIHDKAAVTYPVNFTAAASGLVVSVVANIECGGACDPTLYAYDWNWGDGLPNGTGQSTTGTYLTSGAKTITLTVKLDGKKVGAYTRNITLTATNPPPVAGATFTWNANAWSLHVVDTSTSGVAPLQIVVDWGDGTTKSIGVAGQAFDHTYTRIGTFNAVLRATDKKLRTSTTAPTTVSPAYFSMGGAVTDFSGKALGGATIQIRLGAIVVKTVYTSTTVATLGQFTTPTTLKPGAYSLTVTKSGYKFNNPIPVTIGPSTTPATLVIPALDPSILALPDARKTIPGLTTEGGGGGAITTNAVKR